MIFKIVLPLSLVALAYCVTKSIGDAKARRFGLAAWGAVSSVALGLILFLLWALLSASI